MIPYVYLSPETASYPVGIVCEWTVAPLGFVMSGVASYSIQGWSCSHRLCIMIRCCTTATTSATACFQSTCCRCFCWSSWKGCRRGSAAESATGLFADAFKGCTAGLAAREVVSASVASEEEVASVFASRSCRGSRFFSLRLCWRLYPQISYLQTSYLQIFYPQFSFLLLTLLLSFSSSEADSMFLEVASAFSLEAVVNWLRSCY